ncbi:hypothetical protein ACLQ18_27240 [Streptomyces sp. DT193]|uniref:hypothetical protein n=1 Tax=Streptomyces sp. DT193 TaxID=3393418 RepID=UPI003CF6CEE1
MKALEQFRDQHGDPATWSVAEFDEYLEIGDQQILAAEAARLLIGGTSRSGKVTAAAAAWERGTR